MRVDSSITRLWARRAVLSFRPVSISHGFAAAALDAVATWRYRPSLHRGRPVAVRMLVYVDFELH